MKLKEAEKELKNIKRTSFGISIPELRKLAKYIAKENYIEFIETNTNKTKSDPCRVGFVFL